MVTRFSAQDIASYERRLLYGMPLISDLEADAIRHRIEDLLQMEENNPD